MENYANYCIIHTALPTEASPLVAKLNLKKIIDWHPFELYQQGNVFLAVSLIGKTKAGCALAATITYIKESLSNNKFTKDASLFYTTDFTILNVGIVAADTAMPIGTLGHAVKVVDHSTGRAFYPDHFITAPGMAFTVYTYDRPQTKNSTIIENQVADMEASAIFEAARVYAGSSKVHSLKVVSDHLEPFSLDNKKINTLIEQHTDTICSYVEQLMQPNLTQAPILNVQEIDKLNILFDKFRFTRTQILELKSLAEYRKTKDNQLPDFEHFHKLSAQNKVEQKEIYQLLKAHLV